MTDSTWPEEPHRRKTVLVLDQTDIVALNYKEGGADLLRNDEVYILHSSLKESNPVVQDLIDSGLARPGAVLIQSPFDKNIYENSQQAVERFALDKYTRFSELCSLLGAREVTVEHIEHKNTEGQETVSFRGSSFIVSTGVETENEDLASFCGKLNLHDKFQGGSPDVSAAEEHLRQNGLIDDPVMSSLINQRGNPNNLLTNREYKLDMTSEVKRNFKVLANLDLSFLSLEAGYNRHVREQTEFILRVKVDF